MPITGINWKDNVGYDIHLLRGNRRPALRDGLQFTKSDGTKEDATTYLAANHDVSLDFRPAFRHDIDFTTTPAICSGFGIHINNDTGQIDVDAPPTADPVIHDFLLHAIATDSSDGKQYRTSVRVHLHNRVTGAWLTPPVLTLRPSGAPLPETTSVRFSVRAQFDDDTVGDITRHPNIVWRPTANVEGSGNLK